MHIFILFVCFYLISWKAYFGQCVTLVKGNDLSESLSCKVESFTRASWEMNYCIWYQIQTDACCFFLVVSCSFHTLYYSSAFVNRHIWVELTCASSHIVQMPPVLQSLLGWDCKALSKRRSSYMMMGSHVPKPVSCQHTWRALTSY